MTQTPEPRLGVVAFERLAAAVQAKLAPGARIAWNERISGRQIDGTVRGRLGSTEMLVIIECRDYAEKFGQRHVDALNTVRELVGANKVILVAAHGFTKPALEKAAELGIDTGVLRPSEDTDPSWPGQTATVYEPNGSTHRDEH